MSPAGARLYWVCGGEIMTRGGPLSLGIRDGTASPGCRSVTPQRAAELQAFYVLEARAGADLAARRHCLSCAEQLEAAIADAGRWRRAA